MISPEGSLARIERVLNRLRWKYLRAIEVSPALRDNPARAVSAAFNSAFLSLAGVDKSSCWRVMGFAHQARYDLDWDHECDELASALTEFSRHRGTSTTYAELIALKPGFHEAWLHETFPDDAQEGPEAPRGRVFAMLRGGPLDLIEPFSFDSMDFSDPEAFLAYAPCAVTEGPFVCRKDQVTSYFDDLRRAGTEPLVSARHASLQESFNVLDYCQRLQDEDNAVSLERVIYEAKAFISVGMTSNVAS